MALGIIVVVNKFIIASIELCFNIFQAWIVGLSTAITRLEKKARGAVRILRGQLDNDLKSGLGMGL